MMIPEKTTIKYDGQSPEEFEQALLAAGIPVLPRVDRTNLSPNGIYVSPETRNAYHCYSDGQAEGFRYEQFVASYYQDLALTSRAYVHVFAIELPRPTTPIYIASRTKFTFNSIIGYYSPPALKGIQMNTMEGDFSDFFAVYSRDMHALDAFTAVVPNLMIDMLTSASQYDIEFAGNYVYFYQLYNPPSVTSGDTERVLLKLSSQDYVDMRNFGLKYGSRFIRAARSSKGDTIADTKPLWQIVNDNQQANNKQQLKWLAGIVAYLVVFLLFWQIVIPASVVFIGVRYVQWAYRKRRLLSQWAGRI